MNGSELSNRNSLGFPDGSGLVLELFPCSGGMAEGLRRAGIIVDMAFDWNSDACDSYEQNIGYRPVHVDVRDLLRMARAGWTPGPIGLLVADPPCTPWSRAGKRLGTEDERDMLGTTVELISVLRPTAFLIANVPGLDDAPNWPVVQREIGGLSRCGYCVDYVRLDAADFSVPQHRVRPFWFGRPVGTLGIQWPQRTHGSPKECAHATPTLPGITPLRPWVTVREALAHLLPEEMGRSVRLRWKTKSHSPSEMDAPGKVIPASRPMNRGATVRLNHRPTDADEPAKTITQNPNSDGALILASDRGGNPNAIVLSEKAAAIIQGFPEGWCFCGRTKASRWSQIGMAMPPPLAEAVGRQIVAWMRTSPGAVVQSSSSPAAAGDADSNPRGGDGQSAKEACHVTEGKTPCA